MPSPKTVDNEAKESASTEALEDYAKAVYKLQQRAEGPVGNSALADELGVSPGAVSAMLKRMDELGLVAHVPYKGSQLTAAGERLAIEVIRHHRLLESYLVEVLGMPWDRVHAEAEVLEHYISEDLEERIALALGNPSRDPHGDPIPSSELELETEVTRSLNQLGPGDTGIFVRVSDSDPEMLRYLAEREIAPGERLDVIERQPFQGPLSVRFAKGTFVLGGGLAEKMRVLRRRRRGGAMRKLSRRSLIAGGAAAGALPLLHEVVPHQGLHNQLASAEGGGSTHGVAGGMAAHGGGAAGPTFQAGGVVDHAANGFNPTDILRDFDMGTTRRLPSGRTLREWRSSPTTRRSRSRPGSSTRRGPTTAAFPGPTLRCREGELLRVRFVNGSAHPHTMHFHGFHPAEMDGVPGIGAGLIEPGESTVYEFDADPFGLHLYHCHAGPLAEHIARGHVRRPSIIDPQAGASGSRRDGDGDERLQHQLRRRGQPGLRGQHRRLPLQERADPGQAGRAGSDLPGQHPRVRPDQLVPHPRQLLRLLPDRHAARAERVHRHGGAGAGAARDLSSCASSHPGQYMFHAHKTEFAELGWMGFFEVS